MELNYSTKRTDLFQQVIDLRQKMEDLKSVVRMKNLQIKQLLIHNRKLTIKNKKLQTYNRSFQQQLDNERHFCEELDNQCKKCNTCTSRFQLRQQRELERAFEALQEQNESLKDDLSALDKILYHWFNKFQRVKDTRDLLKQKLELLFQNYLRALAEMMEKLDEAREEFNSIVSTQLYNLPFEKAKYVQIVQKNRELMYENAFYNLEIQKLKYRLDKVTNKMQNLKIDNESTQTDESSITSRSQFLASIDSCSDECVKKQSTGDNNKSKQSVPEIKEIFAFEQVLLCDNCNEPISSDITTSEHDTKTSDASTNATES